MNLSTNRNKLLVFKKVKFSFSRSFSNYLTKRSAYNFFYIYLNFLANDTAINSNYMRKILKDKQYLTSSRAANIFRGRYSVNFLNYFSSRRVFFSNKLFSYKFLVTVFSCKNIVFFFKLQPLNLINYYISGFISFLVKLKCFFIKVNTHITSVLFLAIVTFFFSFFNFLRFSLFLFGGFITYTNKLYSSVSYLYTIFDKSTISLNFVNFWQYFLLFNLLQKKNFLLDYTFNKKLLKNFLTHRSATNLFLNYTFAHFYTVNNKFNNFALMQLLPGYKKLLLQLIFYSTGISSMDQTSDICLHSSKVLPFNNLYFSKVSVSFNNLLVHNSRALCYNLFQVYSNFTFLKANTVLYSKFFEFYILKLARLLTKRGLLLKSYNIINFFFFRLHLLNNSTVDRFIYFSDPFIAILPQLQLTQRFIGEIIIVRLSYLGCCMQINVFLSY
jgi:hypothetical protein